MLAASDDDSCHSLSRSSSLLQFESLEKQCQDISSSSPSILSNISIDSLENHRKNNVSPDSLEQTKSDEEENFYKSLQGQTTNAKQRRSRDSLLYNHTTRLNDSDSSESADSEDTLEETRYDSCKSVDNLKTWRSFDSLNVTSIHKSAKEKMSAENLSEDSGYSDHLCNYMKNRSSSIPNINQVSRGNDKSSTNRDKLNKNDFNENIVESVKERKNVKSESVCVGFTAYDGDVFQNSAWSFGISFQDLSVVEDLIITSEYRTPLINRFLRNGAAKRRIEANRDPIAVREVDNVVNIERTSECNRSSKYNNASASEPNLLHAASASQTVSLIYQQTPESHTDAKQCYFDSRICVSSVPNDLNLSGEAKNITDLWKLAPDSPSIAEKNWDIADISGKVRHSDICTPDFTSHVRTKMTETVKRFARVPEKTNSISSESDIDMASFKREGSYMEAMHNMLDLSDDEHNPCYSDHTPRSTIVEFDRQILKAISETSIKSFYDSNSKLDMLFASTPLSENRRNVVSTPNLSLLKKSSDTGSNRMSDIEHSSSVHDIVRKSSLNDVSSSASGVSDVEEKTLTPSKSFSGSTNSKGVHFSPVVSEVNWQDDSNSPERESSYSLSSTPEKEIVRELTPPIIRPRARMPVPTSSIDPRSYTSQPDLQRHQSFSGKITERDSSFFPLQPKQAVSQPNLNRRRSSLIHKDLDGSVIKAYTARDGVMYKHTHLSLNSSTVYQTSPTAASHVASSNSTEVNSPKPVRSMESEVEQRNARSTRTSKLGGFFSRIASFRFANRKNDDKNKKKKVNATKQSGITPAAPRQATKEDFIYIPLKGPEKPSSNNKFSKVQVDGRVLTDDAACVSAKPPLPKVPPRVVGASVKRRTETAAQSGNPEHRTIDSGDALPRPMEPMGLIETDLDTEVTVITSGSHAKTRSLMNLGAEAPPRSLAAPSHPARPHKSMEFLLDKQNLKVVEVSNFLLPTCY